MKRINLVTVAFVALCFVLGIAGAELGIHWLKTPVQQFSAEAPSQHDMIVGTPRSGQWPAVRKHFLETHPTCAACGTSEHIEVHHAIPFRLHPELECDESNLVSLCAAHHFSLGHLCSFHSYNVNVRADAAAFLKKVQERP